MCCVSMQIGYLLFDPIVDGTSVLNFTELPGTVCLFGGKYRNKSNLATINIDIPTESCGIPAIPSTGSIVHVKLITL